MRIHLKNFDLKNKFFLKNYHTGDINLFWQDIRENAILRTKAYLEKNIDDN
ncbi:hypothetical protein V2605_09705 [Tenacibaculum maritimum]|uniref:hypothetical protein n=1 Tax=Tenacibaculum maritimum TaxID=107401 RepID=UPI001330BA9E|nr:hypothetical protein [Tenacibaculum maritimum]